MEPDRTKDLRQYLQTMLQPNPSYCESLLDDPVLVSDLYNELKPHYEELLDALKSAFPNNDSLKGPVERELGASLGNIPKGETYADTVLNVIEWAESEGCLLELITAAHKRKPKNPLLRVFVMRVLKPLIEEIFPPAQVPAQVQPMQTHPALPTNGNDMRVNGNGAVVDDGSAGINGNGIERTNTTTIDRTVVPPEPGKALSPALPIPFPHRPAPENTKPSENPIDQAYELIRAARDATQRTYDMFQNDEQISEDDAIHQVNEAKEKIEKISSTVEHISVPDHPDLHFRLEGEQQYFCEKASIIVLSIQKIKTQIPPPQFLLTIKDGVEALLQSLQQAENLIGTFKQQIEQLDQTNDSLSESGS